MKRICTLTLPILVAIQFVSAASIPSTVPAATAPREIVAPAPTVAPNVTAAAPGRPKAADIFIPLGNTGRSVSLQELATMKVADLERMTGKKMGLLQRVEVKLAQRKLRHSINADGTISNKRLAMLASGDFDGTEGFHLGGFALGLFLFLIGVLIAYLINDGKHDNRVKWAWIGAGVILVIFLLAHL